jgi:hypothetical protein
MGRGLGPDDVGLGLTLDWASVDGEERRDYPTCSRREGIRRDVVPPLLASIAVLILSLA